MIQKGLLSFQANCGTKWQIATNWKSAQAGTNAFQIGKLCGRVQMWDEIRLVF